MLSRSPLHQNIKITRGRCHGRSKFRGHQCLMYPEVYNKLEVSLHNKMELIKEKEPRQLEVLLNPRPIVWWAMPGHGRSNEKDYRGVWWWLRNNHSCISRHTLELHPQIIRNTILLLIAATEQQPPPGRVCFSPVLELNSTARNPTEIPFRLESHQQWWHGEAYFIQLLIHITT